MVEPYLGDPEMNETLSGLACRYVTEQLAHDRLQMRWAGVTDDGQEPPPGSE